MVSPGRREGGSSLGPSGGAIGEVAWRSLQRALQSRGEWCESRTTVDTGGPDGGGRAFPCSALDQSFTQVGLAGSEPTDSQLVFWAPWPFLVTKDLLPLLVPGDLLFFLGLTVRWVQQEDKNTASSDRWSTLNKFFHDLQIRREPEAGSRYEEVAVG